MERKIENARITATRLGMEDHGIFTASICLDGDGWGVWFGGYALDQWSEPHERRIGTAYGLEFIKQLMDVVGVENWEDLKGQVVRVETEGLGGRALRVGHFLKDKWFDPQTVAKGF